MQLLGLVDRQQMVSNFVTDQIVVDFRAKGRRSKSTQGCSHTVQKPSISPTPMHVKYVLLISYLPFLRIFRPSSTFSSRSQVNFNLTYIITTFLPTALEQKPWIKIYQKGKFSLRDVGTRWGNQLAGGPAVISLTIYFETALCSS